MTEGPKWGAHRGGTSRSASTAARTPKRRSGAGRFAGPAPGRVYNNTTMTLDMAAKKSKVAIECAHCGKTFHVHPYRADTAKFCSRSCTASSRTGEDHSRWVAKETLTCEQCGDEFDVKPSVADVRRFCSRPCYWDAKATGQERVQLGRALKAQLSDRSWQTVARKHRAGECAACGRDGLLHVHHILSPLLGGTNEPWNLMTLCPEHHRRADVETKKRLSTMTFDVSLTFDDEVA